MKKSLRSGQLRCPVVWMAITLTTFMVLLLQASSAAAQGRPKDAEQLLRERLILLQEVAALERKAFEGGQATFESVLRAQTEVLTAQLELTADPVERVKIFQAQLKVAQQLEDVVKKLAEAKQATKSDLLKAQAARLKAQADLIEAQARVKPPGRGSE